jgi:hypothetical protein
VVAVIVAVVVVLVLVVMGVSLLAPLSEQWERRGASMAFWRRESVRQRWRGRRPVLLAYLGLAAVPAIVLVVWVLPSVLTEHPRIPKSAERHAAIASTRTSLVAMLAAIGAAGGLAYTARTYRLSREGHITDRYSKAVEQLGSDKMEVVLGGIYALERLMRDSPADQPTIMETLAAYVREHAPISRPPREADESAVTTVPVATQAPNHPAEDVQAVLTVLGRRHPVDREGPVNLGRTGLTSAELGAAHLAGAVLVAANLTGAWLGDANLAGARLNGANLTRAALVRADLTDARLGEANLAGARLNGANLTGARLGGANLAGARLNAANLTSAVLIGAELADARLVEANLTRVRLRPGALDPDQLAVASHIDEIIWEA